MKTFYIANDNFNIVGHPALTLRSLIQGGDERVVLLTQLQDSGFKTGIGLGVTVDFCLPTTEEARDISPAILGSKIARKLEHYGIDDGDNIVLKMPFPHLLLSTLYALVLGRPSRKKWTLSVLISQTDEGYSWEKINYSDCFALISQMPLALRKRIVLLHEREVLREHWQAQFPDLMMAVCGYVTEWFKKDIDRDVAAATKVDSLKLVYIGEARAEKGFLRVASIVASGELNCPTVLHVEANINNVNEDYNCAIQKLRVASQKDYSIKLVKQRTESRYEDIFKSNHVALMLYSPEYRLRGSGVVQECAAIGMMVVAYEDLQFHLDFPDNVITVKRDQSDSELAAEICSKVEEIQVNKKEWPSPYILTSHEFRQNLVSMFEVSEDNEKDEFVWVITNNVHNQGCSKIIESQQVEIVGQGLVPIFISFEWPDPGIEWSPSVAFDRIWEMQMRRTAKASYGKSHFCIPLIKKTPISSSFNSYHYRELLEVASDVDTGILQEYFDWRKKPVVVMNYIHFHPIVERHVRDLDSVFLEMHDIISVQQQVRIGGDDQVRYQMNIQTEIQDLGKFTHRYSLSDFEVCLLGEYGCVVKSHSYLDVLLRESSTDSGRELAVPLISGEYICIIGSDHPSNVQGVNEFCRREMGNRARSIPIYVFGLVSERLEVSREQLATVNIFPMGYVDDILSVMSGALVTLNPVDLGSGTPIKVLESIACGTPCLVTRRTIEAIGVNPLVIEHDFQKTALTDNLIREFAINARNMYGDKSEVKMYVSNALGRFLNEHFSG